MILRWFKIVFNIMPIWGTLSIFYLYICYINAQLTLLFEEYRISFYFFDCLLFTLPPPSLQLILLLKRILRYIFPYFSPSLHYFTQIYRHTFTNHIYIPCIYVWISYSCIRFYIKKSLHFLLKMGAYLYTFYCN